jgi:membrane glycosyltransferase
LLLPRLLSVATLVARGEAPAFGGVWRLALGAATELLLSTLQAPLRMLAHSLHVLTALTGLKLEWKSPPRGAEAPGWRDAARRIGVPVALPLAAGIGLIGHVDSVVLLPMLLPLALALPLVVVSGHPRAGRAVQRLGLWRTPEDQVRPRPLVRVAECSAFRDLVPLPARASRVAPPRSGWRMMPAGLAAAAVVLAMSVPRAGFAPELAPGWGGEAQLAAYAAGGAPALLPGVERPSLRKRLVVRERPARMIDDALRRRALQAVKRALAEQEAPA